MLLSELQPAKGSTKKTKRRGRGQGSGHGKTSCRGHKGQNSRSGGGKTHMGFEGGQMPLIRRIPKRGFNRVGTVYQVVNLSKLSIFKANDTVDSKILSDKKIVRKGNRPIKILGIGEIDKPLILKVNACSTSAKEKIEQAGGKVEIV